MIKTKQEYLDQFEFDAKQNGGSQEVIRKALARVSIEMEYNKMTSLQAIASNMVEMLIIMERIEENTQIQVTGVDVNESTRGGIPAGIAAAPKVADTTNSTDENENHA